MTQGARATTGNRGPLPIDLEFHEEQLTLRGARGEFNVILDRSAQATRLIASDSVNPDSSCALGEGIIECRSPPGEKANLIVDLVIGPRTSLAVAGVGLNLAIGPIAAEESELELELQPDTFEARDTPKSSGQPGQRAAGGGSNPATSPRPAASGLPLSEPYPGDGDDGVVPRQLLSDDPEAPEASGVRQGSGNRRERPVEPQAPALGGAVASDGGAVLTVAVTDSEVYWTGRRSGALRAERSNLILEALHGDHELDLVDSRVEVYDHVGALSVELKGGEAKIEQQGGDVALQVDQGQVDLFGSSGTTTGWVRASTLRLENGAGRLELEASASNVELLRSGYGQGWSLLATDTQLRASQVDGAAVLEIVGGSAEIEGASQLELSLSAGAEGSAVDVAGQLQAKVTEGAELTVREARGVVVAVVDQAALGVHDVSNLSVDATSATIELSGIRRLRSWKAETSTISADFAALEGNSTIRLDGASEAEIRLGTPCFVRLVGRTTPLSRGLQVNGCEIMTPQHRNRMRRGALSRLDGGSGIVLGIDLDERSSVRIQGS